MKRSRQSLALLSVAVIALAPLTSCANFDTRAKNDAATGALLGAGAGAVLADDKVEGALLGGALGGGAGYLYGKSRE